MAKYNVSKREAKKHGIKRVRIGGGKSGGKDSFSDTLESILGSTDSFRDPAKPFEAVYDDTMKAEDMAQSEALFKPYYAQQISDTMEDLNSWMEMESVNYKRTLRQGRAKMAQMGGAIGQGETGERQQWQGKVGDENERRKAERVRSTEKAVGSEEITKGGFKSGYDNRVGTITDEMNTAIQGQQLWYRNQRADRYHSDVSNMYRQSSGQSFAERFPNINLSNLKL